MVKKSQEEVLSARIGTAFYIAPEVLCKQYSEKCDVWSAGIVLYMMIFNRPPFSGKSETEIIHSILNDEINFQGIFLLNQEPLGVNFRKREKILFLEC